MNNADVFATVLLALDAARIPAICQPCGEISSEIISGCSACVRPEIEASNRRQRIMAAATSNAAIGWAYALVLWLTPAIR